MWVLKDTPNGSPVRAPERSTDQFLELSWNSCLTLGARVYQIHFHTERLE